VAPYYAKSLIGVVFLMCIFVNCNCLACIVVILCVFFYVSLTVHHSIELFSSTNFNAKFFINNMLLHYYPRHVSGINMPIFRRKDCIHTAPGIFALCNVCCVYTIFPPEGGHVNARNMSRMIV
jgi:hypothetical protein